MCLILFVHRAHPRYRLILAANRDEWFDRATAPAGFWPDRPAILAGRDLEQHGTWLGLTRGGRFGAITNFRDPGANRAGARSRGHIVRDFLEDGGPAQAFGCSLATDGGAFNGFNFLGGDGREVVYYSNRAGPPIAVTPGVHGLSNHLLDTDWPKVVNGKTRLAALAAHDRIEPDALFALLDDREPAEDIPAAPGVAPAWERALSAAHIVGQPRFTADGEMGHYGTRSATVILVGAAGDVHYAERSFDREGRITGTAIERFRLDG